MAHCNRIPGHRTGDFAFQWGVFGISVHFSAFQCLISLKVLADKVERLIALLKLSKNTVVYTGIEHMFERFFNILT